MFDYKNLDLNDLSKEINGILYKEEWKSINGWEDLYTVSSFGRVKALKRYVPHYKGGLALVKEKILKLNDRRGYSGAHLYRSEIDKAVFGAHRLVAMAFIENKENNPTVNHIDCDKKNNFYKNLEWSSYSQQQIHAVKNGLRDRTIGNNSNFSKLDNSIIINIRNKFENKEMTISELSKFFNTCDNNVRNIVYRKTWKHI